MYSALPLRSLLVMWATLRFCRLVMPTARWLERTGLRWECHLLATLCCWLCRQAERFVAANGLR